jgi:hypothetical protein
MEAAAVAFHASLANHAKFGGNVSHVKETATTVANKVKRSNG